MELTGRLTANAVIKTLPDERQVINFSIAINDYYKPKGAVEGKEVTLYISCSYWRSTGVAAKLLKGSLVEIWGRMHVHAYAGADGEPKASLNFHCNSIKVHGGGKMRSVNGKQPKKETPIISMVAITDPMDDLPY